MWAGPQTIRVTVTSTTKIIKTMKRLITISVLSILLVSLSGGVYGQRESALTETLSIDHLSWLTGKAQETVVF